MVLAFWIIVLVVLDGLLFQRCSRYRAETDRLKAGMSELERQRVDALVEAEADRTVLIADILRRQAGADNALHLAVNTDSAYVALDRGAARLRTIPADIGPERRVGTPPDTLHVAVPRGVRVVERLLQARDRFDLPAWLWEDRGMLVPEVRSDTGWTGSSAIVTSGGVLIYAAPASGPLADSSYVMPGTVRIAARELRAILDNVSVGMRVYFF